jgi:hypothetical protein
MSMTISHSSAPLPALGTEVTTVILENLTIVMTYAFSQKALATYYNSTRFVGRFKALEHSFFDLPRLTRAPLMPSLWRCGKST